MSKKYWVSCAKCEDRLSVCMCPCPLFYPGTEVSLAPFFLFSTREDPGLSESSVQVLHQKIQLCSQHWSQFSCWFLIYHCVLLITSYMVSAACNKCSLKKKKRGGGGAQNVVIVWYPFPHLSLPSPAFSILVPFYWRVRNHQCASDVINI